MRQILRHIERLHHLILELHFLEHHSVIVTNILFSNRLLMSPWEAMGFGKDLI